MNVRVLPAACRQRDRRKALPARCRQHLRGAVSRVRGSWSQCTRTNESRVLMNVKINRREAIQSAALLGGAGLLAATTGCEQQPQSGPPQSSGRGDNSYANEDYVWLSANASLPL